MRRLSILSILAGLLFPALNAQAQAGHNPSPSKNAVHLSLLGQAGMGSIGYERSIVALSSGKFEGYLAFSAGGYSIQAEDHKDQQLVLNPEYAMLFGKRKHHLELGLLLNFQLLTHSNEWQEVILDRFFPTLRAGYRYQPMGSKLFFRAGVVPTVLYLGDPTLVPWPYLGGGFRF